MNKRAVLVFGGLSWLSLEIAFGQAFWDQTALFIGEINAIAIDSKGNVFAGGIGSGRIFRSMDSGANWEFDTLPLTFGIADLFVAADDKVYAGTDFGVFYSSNSGDTWVQTTLQYYTGSILVVENIILAGVNGLGVFRSQDNGTTWIAAGLTNADVRTLVIGDSGIVFAGTADLGVYSSADTGLTWMPAGLETSPISAMNVSANGFLFAATSIGLSNDYGVFRRPINGELWENFWANGGYWSVDGMTSNSAGHAFLATSGGGVFRSTGGAYWSQVNQGLIDDFGNIYVRSIECSPLDVLFAGTFSHGVFRSVVTTVVEISAEEPEQFVMSQNYPNPFNPTTIFSFSVPQSSIVNLTIYDLLGREVATVVNEKLGPGTYTREWDAAGKASGVYVYRLEAGDFVQSRKLVLIR